MKKYWFILLLLCFHYAARGQTFGYAYWFDNDLEGRQTDTAELPPSVTGAPETVALNIHADVSGLSDGFHTLHVAVDDGQGTVVRVENAYFLKAQTEQMLVRSYVDGLLHSTEAVESGSDGLKHLNVDVSNVPTGIHQLHLMATTPGGTPVATYTTDFVRMATTTELGGLTARCYVDGLLQKVEAVDVNDGVKTIDLDLTNTSLGIHRVDVTLQTEGSAPVAAYSRFFVRNATSEELGGLVCTTYIDGVQYSRETINTGTGVHHIDLDVNRLTKGLHHLHVSAQTLNGRTTSVYNAFFLRMATASQLADEEMKLYYRFDSGQRGVIRGQRTEKGYHFAPDVSKLPAGLHHATFMFADGSNTHGETRNVFFVKESMSSATRYQYWLNGDTASAKTVLVENPGNPTQITTMLSLDSKPLRPSNFHFEVQDERPYAYAVTDLTMRFYNEFDASVDTTASYIDLSSGGEVTNLTTLHPEEADTKACPAADSILWYALTLDEGSGLEVKTSLPSTIEVFSPAGERIHKIIGGGTTEYTGIANGLPTGTYWVAVHTVDNVVVQNPGDTLLVQDVSVTARFTEPVGPIVYDRFTVNGIPYIATAQSGDDWQVTVVNTGTFQNELEVPSQVEYDGHTWTVTGIERGAFANQQGLLAVILPETAVHVGDGLFRGSEQLAAIEWPQPVAMSDSIMEGVTGNPNLLVFVKDRQYAPNNVANLVVDGNAESIRLYDAPMGNNFYSPKPFHAEEISYTHHYGQTSGVGTAHGWESIALPFDVQLFTHETKGNILPMATVMAVEGELTGERPFWLAAMGSDGFYEVENLRANTPYIICMPNNEIYDPDYNLDGSVTFSAQSVEVAASMQLYAGTWNDLVLTPSFQQMEGEGLYELNATNQVAERDGAGDAFVRSYRTVHPFEAYIQATGSSGAKERIPIDGMGLASALGLIQADGDGLWRVYDLMGRLLRETDSRTKALEALPAGIYMLNGVKVLVR